MMPPALTWWRRIAEARRPNLFIGGEANPYMKRWYIIPRNRIFNIYLHQFLRSDDDRALHDHPWWNLSYLLEGSYTEHTIAAGGVNARTIRHAGEKHFRFAKAAHRIELHTGECWSLFFTGPMIRQWGFHCPMGWRAWTVFTKPGAKGEVGLGCD